MKHKMNLNNAPFEMIKSGEKTIELRLNDEKRQRIEINDIIEFSNTETQEVIYVKVIQLYKFNSFRELYKALPLLKFGYTKADINTAKPEDMDLYYTKERQSKYGVLGIELKLV